MDKATKEIYKQAAKIRNQIPRNSAAYVITCEKWQERWKHAKEDTSLSESGLNFGHYISGANSDIIFQFHAMKISVALHHGIALTCWSRGILVMLEKMFGVCLVSKL